MRKKALSLPFFTIVFLSAFFMYGDEGLWPFNMVPVKALHEKYGFKMTQEWLDHFRLSCGKMGGSASFVSSEGLLITNHHVGASAILNLSDSRNDYIKNGYYAVSRDQELRCQGLEVKVLIGIKDVTNRVREAARPEMSPAETEQRIRRAVSDIENESSQDPSIRSEVVSLYAGALYHLYTYRIYDDVRLVFAPEEAMAKFGGDPDNYGYPRYCLDVAFFRVYDNEKPLKARHYLKWNTSGVKENELVFCAGNPAFTFRLLTYAQLEFLRDVKYPLILKKYIRQRDVFEKYSTQGPEQERVAGRDLWGALNEVKCFTGMLSGLHDKEIMKAKFDQEQEIVVSLKEHPDLAERCGQAWDKISGAQQRFSEFYAPFFFFVEGEALRSQYCWMADLLIRFARNSDEAMRSRLESRISVNRPFYPDFEKVRLSQSLSLLQEVLPTHILTQKILKGRNPAEAANAIITGSRLNDMAFRKELLAGVKKRILASDDSAIQLALMLEDHKRNLQNRYRTEVQSAETAYGAQISQVIFALKGASVAPDTTHTLRLSWGTTKSYYEDDGSFIPYQTFFKGLFDRSDRANNRPPYELAPSFLKARSKINMDAPYNLAATCDSSGGNSGSPLINTKGEFVGILFDGNRQSLPRRFLYDDEQVRSVMVHALGIMEALDKVYGAEKLVKELLSD